MTTATPEDLANGIKLLERLRTGELSVTQGSGRPANPGDAFAMLQRVEDVLRGAYTRVAEPVGDGGPAFPCEWDYINSNRAVANGMTLRDYAAIKFAAAWVPVLGLTTMPETREQRADEAVRLGLLQADAMLKARQP